MTNEEKKKLYAALAAPFPEEAIERTDGRMTGRGYSTTGIKYQYVVNRLNEVLGVGGWRANRTVTVKEVATSKGRPAFEAICDIVLQLGQWVDGVFVVFAEALADGGHTAMSEADSRKGSYTNAFKKAAAFFGVGKQAYEGTLDDDNVPGESALDQAEPPPTPPAAAITRLPAAAGPAAPARTAAPSRNRLTSKQLAAIWAIGRKAGHDQHGLRSMIKQRFATQPEFLSREQASQVIEGLTKLTGNGSAEHLREVGQEG